MDLIIVDIKLAPRGENKIAVNFDDFTLISRKDGQRSQPLAPAQIAGRGALVVAQGGPGGGGGMVNGGRGPIWGGVPGTGTRPRRVGGDGESGAVGAPTETKAAVTTGSKEQDNPLLAVLKKKALPQIETNEPVSGLLYFFLEGKHKLKDLELMYKSPAGRLILDFEKINADLGSGYPSARDRSGHHGAQSATRGGLRFGARLTSAAAYEDAQDTRSRAHADGMGATGVTVAKTTEGEVMLKAEPKELLVAYPVLGKSKMDRLVRLARETNVTVSLDSIIVAEAISEAAREAAVTIGVLVEIDAGLHRVGVTTEEALRQLALGGRQTSRFAIRRHRLLPRTHQADGSAGNRHSA